MKKEKSKNIAGNCKGVTVTMNQGILAGQEGNTDIRRQWTLNNL